MLHETSRRSFMVALGAGAGLLPSFARGEADGEAYWEMVRRQFSFRDDRVPMNAANLCPVPRAVADRVAELDRDIDLDCSFNNRAKFGRLREESRRSVAEHLGVTADEVALVRNTSEANNIVVNGLALKAGDEVVLWDLNHPTNNVAWDVRAARTGLKVRRVAVPRHPKNTGDLVRPFQDAMGPRTRVLAVTDVSNVTGLRIPVRELCDVAHRRGIFVHVDGAQTWGALNVNLREKGCDAYSASSHKWFLGPRESGILFVKSAHVASLWPSVVGSGWGNDLEPDVKGARKFESMGQRDDACLAGIATAAGFHRRIGPDRIEARVTELAGALREGLKEAGFSLVTPLDPKFSGGVCIIESRRETRQQVVDKLYNEHGIAGAPTGGLRLCPHVYNTREHVERALKGIKAMRKLIL